MAKITLQEALEKGYESVRGSDSFERSIMELLPQRVENEIREVLNREGTLQNAKWILEDLANDGKVQGQHGYGQADLAELAKISLNRAEAAKLIGQRGPDNAAANDASNDKRPAKLRPHHLDNSPKAVHLPRKTSEPKAAEHHDRHHGHVQSYRGGRNHASHAPGEGDIPVFDPHASGHIGPSHGRTLNANELDSIGRTLGLPSAAQLVPSLESNGAYNPGQTAQQKMAGAYLALSTAAKFETMPPSNFSDAKTAARAYGELKIKAMADDADGVRDTLKRHGGSAGGLSDQQLTNLWSGNEHQNLHGVLFGNSKIYNPIHATSLNDNDKTGSGVRSGGFNDRGEYPQWGWFEDAQSFNQRLVGKAANAVALRQPAQQQPQQQPQREVRVQQQSSFIQSDRGGSDLSKQPSSLAQWGHMVEAAAKASGVPAPILAGQIWAESRGRGHTDTQNPDGKTRDVGVMQIGQERWQRDVVTKLTDAQKASIRQAAGVAAEDLDMHNPLHNVIGGAFHLLNWRNGAYGQPSTGGWEKALNGYVNGDINTPRYIGPSNYSDLVRGYAQMVVSQIPLRLEDYQHPELFGG